MWVWVFVWVFVVVMVCRCTLRPHVTVGFLHHVRLPVLFDAH